MFLTPHTPFGINRCRKVRHTLPARAELAALPLDISLAPAPARTRVDDARPEIVVYVLDAEPILFAAAALFAFAQSQYFDGCANAAHDAEYARMFVVGVGHAHELFDLDESGFDRAQLRDLRRRDFPPFDHPSVRVGRGANAAAARFVDALINEIVPLAERALLGVSSVPPRRCVLGSSYSAVLALQAAMAQPTVFDDVILGSPSVCFDPEIVDTVKHAEFRNDQAFFLALGELETTTPASAANVHTEMATHTERLAAQLRGRGVHVDGVHVIAGEDHTSLKLALVSRGLGWLARRSAAAALASERPS